MEISESQIAKERTFYVGRCVYCGFEIRNKKILGSSVPITKTGSYGTNATPQPVTFADEMYVATTVSFVAAAGSTPAYLADSANLFGDKGFHTGMTIRVACSASDTNDGDFTIADGGVSRGEILLSSSDSLTTQSAASAGTVTISRVIHKPQISQGCPFCGSLASR
ncbi:MAG: hypothetical protein Q7K21_00230 [Elusimicrobiota bacterium]|nr:hypothetical protein [Elusimicrobiota bacterium]